VQAVGGGGFGRGTGGGRPEAGGGGGGAIDAAPVGFIEVGPSGARFEAIPDPAGTARALRTGATALTTLLGAAAGAAALRRRAGAGRAPARGLLRR
jgi:hypothetical protein